MRGDSGSVSALSVVSVGSAGTATGQLYVSGSIPTSALSSTSLLGAAEGLYVQGKYAYVVDSTNGKLQIYDVSNPASPLNVGQLNLATSTTPWGITVVGNYAYITNYGTNKLQIVDVSNPAVPTSVSTISTGTGPHSVAVEGHYAYVVNDNGGGGGGSLQVFDISNPTVPAQVGSNFTASISSPKRVYAQGRYLYIGNASSATVQVVDISNPASPSSVSTLNGGMTSPHSMTVAGRYVYVADFGGNQLAIFDESLPGTPALAGSISTGASSNPQGVYVEGRYAYVVNGATNDMKVFDVSTPTAPTLVGTIPTVTDPIDVKIVGRYAYVLGESSDALQIFDLGGTYTQQLESGGSETGNLQVDNNASIQNNLDVRGGLEVSGGSVTRGDAAVFGAASFQSATNSTSAFQVQNSASVAFFTVDTTNERVYIGPTAGDTTGALLVLGNKNTSGDPTGTNGGMYYNSNIHEFRCFRDNGWEPCGINPIDRGFQISDDWLGGNPTTNGAIGNAGWTRQDIGVAADNSESYNNGMTPSASHPGVYNMAPNGGSGTATNNGVTITLGSSSNPGSMQLNPGDVIKTTVAVGSATNTSQIMRVGAHNETTATGQPTTGVWWEADPASYANWQYCYTDGTPTPVCAPSATAIASNTWVRLEIQVVALGSGTSTVTYTINGTSSTVSAGTVNTNSLVSPAITCIAVPSSVQHCYADYYQLYGLTNSVR